MISKEKKSKDLITELPYLPQLCLREEFVKSIKV